MTRSVSLGLEFYCRNHPRRRSGFVETVRITNRATERPRLATLCMDTELTYTGSPSSSVLYRATCLLQSCFRLAGFGTCLIPFIDYWNLAFKKVLCFLGCFVDISGDSTGLYQPHTCSSSINSSVPLIFASPSQVLSK